MTMFQFENLNEKLFNRVVCFAYSYPSGLGGPGTLLMYTEDGEEYLADQRGLVEYDWFKLDEIVPFRDESRFKEYYWGIGVHLYIRNDLYDKVISAMESIEKIEKINWRYELRTPLFEKDDLVEFYFDKGKKKTKCKGVIVGTDIYRIHGKIETIEYDILVEDYETYRNKCLYKHIDEKHIKATPGKLLILSGFSGVGKGTVIQQLLTEYPEKYVVSVSATTRKPRKGEVDGKSYYFKKREEFEDLINKNEFLEFAEYAGEYYGTLKKDVYKNCFKGKNVIIEIDSQGARQIREKQKIQSVFLIPPSFEELLHRLKNRGTESKESIHRRLKQALDEIEHIEEYGVLLVNDSVEGTAFVIDALFHPSLKNASGMNERELKIAREIQEGIIKYLSDEEGE